MDTTEDRAGAYVESMDSVPGWFVRLDAQLFLAVDAWQRQAAITGNLLEIGVFAGRSAVLLGHLPAPGERLEVCDLFEGQIPTATTDADRGVYDSLRRSEFESGFLRWHAGLPSIHQCPSSDLSSRIGAGSMRFIHIDGSHLYDPVASDLALSRDLLVPGGVVVLDDWCTERTPGVAAATWEAVRRDGLRPFAFTQDKVYATWSGAAPSPSEVAAWFDADPTVGSERHRVGSHEMVRLFSTGARTPAGRIAERWLPPAARPALVRARARVREAGWRSRA